MTTFTTFLSHLRAILDAALSLTFIALGLAGILAVLQIRREASTIGQFVRYLMAVLKSQDDRVPVKIEGISGIEGFDGVVVREHEDSDPIGAGGSGDPGPPLRLVGGRRGEGGPA
jgi:hypothetical protein